MVTYADRPWLKNYDPGIPHTLAPYPEAAMHDFLRAVAKQRPQTPALITSAKLPVVGRLQKVITYGELDQLSDALACALIKLGVKPGDRVAVVLPNVAAFPIAFYGVLKAGAIVAATNPTYPAAKMQHQINDCDAEVVITLSLFYNMIKEVQPQTKVRHVIVTNVKEGLPPLASLLFTLAKEKKGGHRVDSLPAGDFWLPDLLKQNAGSNPYVTVNPDDVALYQYTGGTTGTSKGAMLTHRALVINTLQMQTWWRKIDGEPFLSTKSEDIIFLGAIPMFHVAGLIAVMAQAMAAGSPIVLVANPRDLDELIDVIAHYKPNAFVGVPALYNAINNHPRIKSGEVSLKSLIISSSGTAPLSPATKREYEKISGNVITEGYGMSEMSVTHANPILKPGKLGAIGLPYPDVDARIVSLEDGETDVPVGDIGEIVVSAATIMRGYHKMPTETANMIREQNGKRWIFTGDIGRMDEDGYFYIVDRKKDMVIIGGFNVYPTTIENVLKEHPAVLETAVAGIAHPDKIGQETIKAWVVFRPEMSATEKELEEHCSKFLASYEVPRRFAFVKEIPKTAVGKTLRRELVQMELAEQEKRKA